MSSINSETEKIIEKKVRVTIIRCEGNRCRHKWDDGSGIHCESCCDNYSDDEDAPDDYMVPLNTTHDVEWLECSGSKCRRCHQEDGEGVCCYSCGCERDSQGNHL